MKLVERQEIRGASSRLFADDRPILGVVMVRVLRRTKTFRDQARQIGFAHLTGTGQQDHLLFEIPPGYAPWGDFTAFACGLVAPIRKQMRIGRAAVLQDIPSRPKTPSAAHAQATRARPAQKAALPRLARVSRPRHEPRAGRLLTDDF